MKRWFIGGALALCAFSFTAPAIAEVPPALPAPARSFDSGSLRVDVYGTAGKPALVFIPGLTCGPWEWAGEIARFSPSYTIYALTLPGFDGRAPISTPLFQTVTGDFWTMLQSQHVDRPVVIGHSLGGTLAILLAEQHSDWLRAVVAVDGLPILPGLDRQTPQQRQAEAQQIGAMIAAADTPAKFEAAQKTFVLPNYVTAPADVDAIATLVAKSDPKASAAWMTEDMISDFRPGLKNVTVPLLEIAPYDPTIDARMAPAAAAKQAYYASLLANDPSAKVEMIQPSRHFVMYDQAQKLDAALTSFLQAQP